MRVTLDSFRPLIRGVGVGALLLVLASLLVGESQPLKAGQRAPTLSARGLDGQEHDVVFATDAPTVVNVWATWCPPCLMELPEFQAAHGHYQDRVHFIGLATESSAADVTRTVARFGITYDVGRIDGAHAAAWNATALPSTYVVGVDGRVIWSVRGAIDEAVLNKHLAPLLK